MSMTLTRWGLWAIPVAGVLTLPPWIILLFGAFGGGGPGSDAATRALLATGIREAVFGNLYILGVLCLLFGILAISALLVDTPAGGWAALGMILGLAALVGVAGVSIILTYVDAVLGDLYLSGHTGAGEVFTSMSGGSWSPRFIPLFIVGGLAGLIAAISFGVALWRSARMPKWVAVVFAFAFLGEVFFAPVVTLVAAALLIVSGVVMAREMAQPAAASSARV